MTENKDLDLMELDVNDEFLKNYKAVYYMMNAKPDSIQKLFQRNVVIENNDICELNKSIINKIKTQFDDTLFSISVNVSLSNKKYISFRSWNEFESYQWSENESINGITLAWDFMLKLPKYKFPQRHNLMVKLSNGMRPEEMFKLIISGNIEDVEGLDSEFLPIVVRVDFIDRLIGDELINIVEKWIDGLNNPIERHGKVILALKKHKRKVALFTNYFFSFVLLLVGMYSLNSVFLSYSIDLISEITINQFLLLVNSIFVFVLIFLFLYNFSGFIARTIFRNLEDYGDVHIFHITKGDKKIQKKMLEKDKKTKIGIFGKFTLNVVLNVLCGILVAIFF